MEYCQGGDLRALIRKKLHEEEYFSYSQVKYQGSAGPKTDGQGTLRSGDFEVRERSLDNHKNPFDRNIQESRAAVKI